MKIPVLKGYVRNEQFHVWCPFCVRWHFHGIPAGHRSAHCKAYIGEGPFAQTGYYIRPFTKAEVKQIQAGGA